MTWRVDQQTGTKTYRSMTPAEHIASAEHLLDRAEAHTVTDGVLLAIGHAVVGWVRHEAGLWEDA